LNPDRAFIKSENFFRDIRKWKVRGIYMLEKIKKKKPQAANKTKKIKQNIFDEINYIISTTK